MFRLGVFDGPVLLNERLAPGLLDSIYPAEYGSYNNNASKRMAHILGERRDDKNLGISNPRKISLESGGECPAKRVVFIPPAYPANALNPYFLLALRYCKGHCISSSSSAAA